MHARFAKTIYNGPVLLGTKQYTFYWLSKCFHIYTLQYFLLTFSWLLLTWLPCTLYLSSWVPIAGPIVEQWQVEFLTLQQRQSGGSFNPSSPQLFHPSIALSLFLFFRPDLTFSAAAYSPDVDSLFHLSSSLSFTKPLSQSLSLSLLNPYFSNWKGKLFHSLSCLLKVRIGKQIETMLLLDRNKQHKM